MIILRTYSLTEAVLNNESALNIKKYKDVILNSLPLSV